MVSFASLLGKGFLAYLAYWFGLKASDAHWFGVLGRFPLPTPHQVSGSPFVASKMPPPPLEAFFGGKLGKVLEM